MNTSIEKLGLNDLERQVLEKILSGDTTIDQIIREQLSRSEVSKRTYTGVGFLIEFQVPGDVPILADKSFSYGDVSADLPGLEHGAGFFVMITEGKIDYFEGFTYAEPWPENAKIEKFFS